MPRLPEESPTWPTDRDADTLLDDLRRQIDAARARLREHRDQMRAAGLCSDEATDAEAST
jgi:hypothetical protein